MSTSWRWAQLSSAEHGCRYLVLLCILLSPQPFMLWKFLMTKSYSPSADYSSAVWWSSAYTVKIRHKLQKFIESGHQSLFLWWFWAVFWGTCQWNPWGLDSRTFQMQESPSAQVECWDFGVSSSLWNSGKPPPEIHVLTQKVLKKCSKGAWEKKAINGWTRWQSRNV